MGWFDKKEEVPELPKAPAFPEVPLTPQNTIDTIKKPDLPKLPSFPSNSRNENLNQEKVKHTVDDNQGDEDNSYDSYEEEVDRGHLPDIEGFSNNPIPDIPELPKINSHSTQKHNQMIPSINEIQKPRTLEIQDNLDNKQKAKQDEPIFVRIDKFQSAQKNFDKIKSKSKEIETILRKVKELKSKEDKEIQSWTEDLEMIKSRLVEIESDIFDKI